VAGIPASESIAIVMGHASQGRLAPMPDSAAMSSPSPVSRSRAATTANAATFMNV
jgi:hypothetical protein